MIVLTASIGEVFKFSTSLVFVFELVIWCKIRQY